MKLRYWLRFLKSAQIQMPERSRHTVMPLSEARNMGEGLTSSVETQISTCGVNIHARSIYCEQHGYRLSPCIIKVYRAEFTHLE